MKNSKPVYAVLALTLLSSSLSAWAASPEENRRSAALVEWAVANCATPKISGLITSLAMMTINGSLAEDMAAAREFVRKGVADNYASTEAACADILPGLRAGPH